MRAQTIVAATALLCATSLGFAADAPVIKIGALFAVTGPASYLGAPEQRTAEMLVEQLNAKGGVAGRKLVLIVKDTQGSPEKAISFAKQLIEEDQVFAIIGPSTSGETMKIKGLCEETKTLLISCAAAEDIVRPLARYVFKTPQTDADAARRIFEVLKKRKLTKVAILSSNTGFGSAGKKQLEALAPEYGITIGANETYDKTATDLTDVATKVKAANVQAVINWSIEPAQAIIAKNLRQIGVTMPLFQSHGFGNLSYVTVAKEAAEGIIFPCGRLLVADVLPAKHPQKALLMKYKMDYQTRYPSDAVSTFGGHAYDALLILAKAVEVAGADREKARDAIEGIRGLVGTAGLFNFSPTDHNGLTADAFEMLTVKGGRFVLYKD
jgi:branched-chain amino acid transport system substrate-binding protein